MLSAARTPPHLITLILLTAVSVLTLNMFLPSLPGIAADFGVSYGVASLSVSGYLAVTAVLQVVLGPVSDRLGRRSGLIWCCVIFTVASVVAALAQHIVLFLAARVVQAAVIAGAALAAAIVRDMRNEADSARLLSWVAMAMAVAPMLAPMIGGVLDAAFGWRSVFWVYSGVGFALVLLVWTDLGETKPKGTDTIQDQIRESRELIRSQRFWAYTLCLSFSVGIFYIFLSGAPLVATEVFGMSTTTLGMAIGSITMGFFVGSFLSGRFLAQVGPLGMILAGRWVAVVGLSISIGALILGVTQPILYFGGAVCAGMGNGLTVPSARAGTMSVRPKLAGTAAGLSGAMIVAFGAVLTVLPGAILTPQNADWMLLILMFVTGLAALASGLWVVVLNKRAKATA